MAVGIALELQVLKELHEQLQAIRHVPHRLLKQPAGAEPLSAHFQALSLFADTIRSDAVQEALRASAESFRADSADLNADLRRDTRRRRRPPSPETPRPYVPVESKSTSLVSTVEHGGALLNIDTLPGYIREFNATHDAKLHIWRRTRGAPLQAPIIVRFTIPDILTAYLTLVTEPEFESALLTEGLTTFGPRERKPPHSQSDFTVYRLLSQQIGKMLQSDPQVRVETVVKLLCSYRGLFTERCGRCERVLSSEGHVPAVVRLWGEGGGVEHVACAAG